jgi:hypothetical protein
LIFQQQCNIDEDEVDRGSMWKNNIPPPIQNHQMQHFHFSNSSGSNIRPNKDKFIRSDSILASSNNDENFDNMTASGKYGAIGGLNKSPDASQQWSGLSGYDIAGSSGNNNLGGNILKIVDAMNKNGDHTPSLSAHPYGGMNGNFLNINVG